MAQATIVQALAAGLFVLAIAHTFASGLFERLALRHPAHAGAWHLLGEVEVVFGLWAMVLVCALFAIEGRGATLRYLESLSFTEPLFVFAIMVVAGTRPVLQFANRLALKLAQGLTRLIPVPDSTAFYLVTLSFIPLLGSFITEPAAMTLAALILRDRFFSQSLSANLRYATLGVLFVNISIGGTLTPFAAPPVLMVAASWNWDLAFMMSHFGARASIAVVINALALTLWFRKELADLKAPGTDDTVLAVPRTLTLLHLALLSGLVWFAHDPVIFLGLFLFFMGVTQAYEKYQDRLMLREALLVAYFLAGLVVLGGQQRWWLQPLLLSMSPQSVFYGAAALTALTDNAALTYLGSLVDGLSEAFKYCLVAGAVTGGGLTIIANAPNPAGIAILRGRFEDETVHPLRMFVAALPPTLVAGLAFML